MVVDAGKTRWATSIVSSASLCSLPDFRCLFLSTYCTGNSWPFVSEILILLDCCPLTRPPPWVQFAVRCPCCLVEAAGRCTPRRGIMCGCSWSIYRGMRKERWGHLGEVTSNDRESGSDVENVNLSSRSRGAAIFYKMTTPSQNIGIHFLIGFSQSSRFNLLFASESLLYLPTEKFRQRWISSSMSPYSRRGNIAETSKFNNSTLNV
jgi:hypothetical protein